MSQHDLSDRVLKQLDRLLDLWERQISHAERTGERVERQTAERLALDREKMEKTTQKSLQLVPKAEW